jgi:streptogramin lyase
MRPRYLFRVFVVTIGLMSASTGAQVVTEFSAGISAGSAPRHITLGPDGNLWFTELDGSRIGRITPSGVVTEFSAGITANAQPFSITAGPDGNLWFVERGLNRIGRITPAGVVTEFSAGISAGAQLTGITAGPDGNLWFTEPVSIESGGLPRKVSSLSSMPPLASASVLGSSRPVSMATCGSRITTTAGLGGLPRSASLPNTALG